MSARSDGGPAFPMQDAQAIAAYAIAKSQHLPDVDHRDAAFTQARAEAIGGMSLRDYFAAKALVALVAEPSWSDVESPMIISLTANRRETDDIPGRRAARAAYVLADAMLAERDR